MNSEGKFWTGLGAIMAMAIVLIATISAEYWKDRNATIAKMVKSGADPLAAMCAIEEYRGDMPVCVILAAQKAK